MKGGDNRLEKTCNILPVNEEEIIRIPKAERLDGGDKIETNAREKKTIKIEYVKNSFFATSV